jgi:uncharacterized membrane protein YgcG
MKKFKGIIGVILTVAIIITASSVYALSTSKSGYEITSSTSKSGYEITSYNVDMVVTEKNVLKITETIDVYFNEHRHGIYRKIPLKGTILRNDGSQGKFSASISNINVNDSFTTSTTYGEGKTIELKIGNAEYTVIGKQQYVISYDYRLEGDNVRDYDELYYNLIGTEWDATISNITFSIKMPKDFDTSKIGFTQGKIGSVDTSGITYDIDGNTITGSYDGTLTANNGLTVRIELPEGYFDVINIRLYRDYAICAIFIVLVFIVFLLNFKDIRDKRIVETVEFYPPDNMNSLDLAFAYKEYASGQDVTSLLIYLANKGYLKIEEKDKSASKDDSFKIIKLKEYDGNNKAEKIFFEGLFKKGDEVTTSDLNNKFYKTQNKILKLINKKSNKEKILDKKSAKNKIAITVIEFIVFIIMTFIVVFADDMINESLYCLPFLLIFFFLLKNAISILKNKKSVQFTEGIIKLFAAIILFVVLQSIIFKDYMKLKSYDWMAFGVGILGLIILEYLSIIISDRNKYGIKLLGKIRGFKRFLENARKDELEKLVMENPTYFYDILPYTYVLGVSDKWIKKFESINIISPVWYDSSNNYSETSIGEKIDKAFEKSNNAMSSSTIKIISYSYSSKRSSSSISSERSNDSFSGHGSGGGSSGHGSGGGGGGSW